MKARTLIEVFLGWMMFAASATALADRTNIVLSTGMRSDDTIQMASGGSSGISYVVFTRTNALAGRDVWVARVTADGAVTTDLVDVCDTSGSPVSIAVDPQSGEPAVAYYNYGATQGLRYAWCSNGVWRAETVCDAGVNCSLVIGTNGVPDLFLNSTGDYNLLHARKVGTTWSWWTESWNNACFESARVNPYDGKISISYKTLGWTGNPSLLWYQGAETDGKVDGGGTYPGAPDGCYVGTGNSLAFATNGPHISYFDDTMWRLKHAYWNANERVWEVQVVDTNAWGWSTSLQIDNSNNAFIVYACGSSPYVKPTDLRLASFYGAQWRQETLITSSNLSPWSSLVVGDRLIRVGYIADGVAALIEKTVDAGPLLCSFKTSSPRRGITPLAVDFTAAVSGTNSSPVYCQWDLDGDGGVDREGWGCLTSGYAYTSEGLYTVRLSVSNAAGETAQYAWTNCVMALATNVHFVSLSGTHTYPFSSWQTAATNIQDAVNAALDGGVVFVTNGTYRSPVQITLSQPVTIRSLNGAGTTVVDGGGTHPCFYLYSSNITVAGFTVTHGSSGGIAGSYSAVNAHVLNCAIRENAGGGIRGLGISTVRNCLIAENSAWQGAGIYCNGNMVIENCTIVSNRASDAGGGLYFVSGKVLVRNSIVALNTSPVADAENWQGAITAEFQNVCSAPLPPGQSNTDADPLFVNSFVGDYRLSDNSPLVDAGTNFDWMANGTDLDGKPRIIHGKADVGAYEAILPFWDTDADGIPDLWTYRYFGHLTGMADDNSRASDSASGTGSNLDKYVADLDPTNPSSIFRIVAVSSVVSGRSVSFTSSSNRVYSLFYTTNLLSSSWISVPAVENVRGIGGLMALSDEAGMESARFYRIGVQVP